MKSLLIVYTLFMPFRMSHSFENLSNKGSAQWLTPPNPLPVQYKDDGIPQGFFGAVTLACGPLQGEPEYLNFIRL